MNIRLILKIFLLLLIFSSQSVFAQYSVFNHFEKEKYVELYVAKSVLTDDVSEINAISNVGVLSSQFFCSSTYCFMAELPYSYVKYDYSSPFMNESDSEFILGNPRLGMRKYFGENYQLDFSLVLPNVSSKDEFFAFYYGVLTRNDEYEMFFPELTSLSIVGLVRFFEDSIVKPYFKIGMLGWKLDDFNDDTRYELLNKYVVGLDFSPNLFSIIAKIKGMTILTESDLDFGERNINSFVLAFKIKSKFQPGMYFIAPLDELNDSVKYTIGVGIETTF